jgi:CO dehydrogenase maturation factor
VKIAVTGKGGVGKTTIAGTLAYLLHRSGFKVLAVDADPNTNLSSTLGLGAEEAEQIIPISENSSLIEEKTGVKPNSYGAVFRLSFTVDDVVERYSVKTPCGVNLLVMGVVREAAKGCMCPANYLIRMLLRHLLVQREEALVADMEAGTEHFARGTAKHVDGMLVVVEPSAKALETARRIRNLAVQLGIERILIVGNKIMNERDEAIIQGFAGKNQLPVLGMVPYDLNVRDADLSGDSLFLTFPSTAAVQEIEAICKRLVKLVSE